MIRLLTFTKFKKELKSTSDEKRRKALIRNYIKQRLSSKGFPIVEGKNVTFIYIGEVRDKISVIGDMNNWKPEVDLMKRINGTNVYYKRMRFPLDARIEYAYMKDGKLILDLLNKKISLGGLGPYSELQMPNYKPSKEIDYNPKIHHGKIEAFRFNSKILNNNRLIHVYLPHNYDPSKSYPTIYAQDGGDYLRFGFFDTVLDNLIEKTLIKEVIAVFIDPVNRLFEYDLNDKYVNFLVEELVPYIDANYSTKQNPSDRLVMGASFGGLISVYAAFRHPEVFGNVASQSGFLSRKKGQVMREIEKSSKKNIKFYLDCGTFESNVGGVFGNFTKANRKMCEILKRKGYNFIYQEVHEGHNWGNWRSRLGDILMTFFKAS